MIINLLKISISFLTVTLLTASCGSESKVTATAQGVVISREKSFPAFVFIPDIFPGERTQHQTYSVLLLSADEAAARDFDVTRLFNSTTDADIVDVEIFKNSLATRVMLGMRDQRDQFVYGENLLRLEMTNSLGDPSYSERLIVLQDYSQGSTGLSGKIVNGFSAGQVESVTGPVQIGNGGVLTTSFIPMVYQ